MNFKQKIAYMAIGCLFTLAGYFLATLGSGGFNPQNASAQAPTQRRSPFTTPEVNPQNASEPASDGKAINEIILCRKLMIVNAKGKPVAVLGDRGEGGGALSIYNKAGKMVAKLDSTDGNGMVSILNKEGLPVGFMGVDDRGLGIMGTMNKAGNIVAKLQVGKNGNGGLTIANKEEIPIAIIIADRNDNGSLVITNKEGKAVAGLAVTDKGGRLGSFYEGKWRYY